MPEQGLGDDDRLNLTFLRRVVAFQLEGQAFDSGRLGFSNEGGPEGFLDYIGSSTVIRSRADADAYLARLEAFAKYIDDTTANMRRGVKTGWVQSRATVDVALPQMKANAARPVTDNAGWLQPLAKLPDTIPAAEQQALRAARPQHHRDQDQARPSRPS